MVAILCVGIFFSWFNINVPFRQISEETLINADQMRLNFLIALFSLLIGGIATAIISRYVSSSLKLILCALMFFTCFFSLSLQTVTFQYSDNYVLLFISYGGLGGLASGMIIMTTGAIIDIFFKRKKYISFPVIIICILTGLYGIGNIIRIFGERETAEWRDIYLIMAISLGIVILISAFIIKTPDEVYDKSMKIEEDPV